MKSSKKYEKYVNVRIEKTENGDMLILNIDWLAICLDALEEVLTRNSTAGIYIIVEDQLVVL